MPPSAVHTDPITSHTSKWWGFLPYYIYISFPLFHHLCHMKSVQHKVVFICHPILHLIGVSLSPSLCVPEWSQRPCQSGLQLFFSWAPAALELSSAKQSEKLLTTWSDNRKAHRNYSTSRPAFQGASSSPTSSPVLSSYSSGSLSQHPQGSEWLFRANPEHCLPLWWM